MTFISKQGMDIHDEDFQDEGWWDSVLSDEGKNFNSDPEEPFARNSGHPIKDTAIWEELEQIHTQDEIIQLDVIGYNRGGLLVEYHGVQGFVPVSHLVHSPEGATEEERKHFLMEYLGNPMKLKVIECDPTEGRIVFSERAARAGEGSRKQIFERIKAGDIVTGMVTNITDFGVFVDLGGLEGLIHVSELSWGRVQNPSDILCVGQKIQSQVLSVSVENSRIALSYKRLSNNPWEEIEKIYAPGDLVTAKISGITKYGAFARLKEGVEGLIHRSTIDIPEGVDELEEFLQPDQCVRVKILHVDAEKKRIGLALAGYGE